MALYSQEDVFDICASQKEDVLGSYIKSMAFKKPFCKDHFKTYLTLKAITITFLESL